MTEKDTQNDHQLGVYHEKSLNWTSPPNKSWVKGSGASNSEWKNHKKVEVDPYASDRPAVNNYRLLVSAITPRPVGFISTISKDGIHNLAPYSYFNVVNSDPPLFALGTSHKAGEPKDTARNILETGEATINIISDWFIEAANHTSADAPEDVDEWDLSGLTKAPSSKVKPPHVAESAFSVEVKLLLHQVIESKAQKGRKAATVFILEGVNFHAREDVVNKDFSGLDLEKLKPVARFGGSTYGVTTNVFDIARPNYEPSE